MTIIINGFHKPQYFPLVQTILERYSAKKAHIIYEHEKAAPKTGASIVYYPCAVLSHEFQYETPAEKLLPLDEETIRLMADCEAVCLKMMDRDELYIEWSYEKRKHAYLTHLRYWNHVIQADDVKLFISSNIPHVIYDFIIFSLCKLKGIKTILFFQFQPGISILMEDWKKLTPGMKEKLALIKDEKLERPLSPRMQEEWNHQRSGKDTTPFYIQGFIESYAKKVRRANVDTFLLILKQFGGLITKPLKKIKRLLDLDFVEWFLHTKIQEHRYKKIEMQRAVDYEKLCSEPKLDEKYIYLPLHTQPEMSTSPMAGVFVDPLVIVQLVAYCVPKDVKIYVKEHPTQHLVRRDADFYEKLLQIPSVKLVSRQFPSATLAKHCMAIGTSTGTAGWEALFKGKPVLLFGHPFYEDAPGVFPIHTLHDCRHAIQEISSGRTLITDEALHHFLLKLDDYLVYADIDPDYSGRTNLTTEQNTAVIMKALVENLR